MKKLLTLIISAVIVAAISIGVIVVVVSHQNDQEHNLTVSTTYGGTLDLSIDQQKYTIKSDEAQMFKVKKKSKISVIAKPDANYSFLKFLLNGIEYSAEKEINITVDKESELHAKFGSKTVKTTITEGSSSETINIDLAKNLLAQLNMKYTAPAGYTYTYKIGETVVDSNTKISTATTITRIKNLINYTVTFKHDGAQVGEVLNYNVENKNITAPTVPSAEHYTVAWDSYSLDNLGDIVVNSVKTPIEYPISFVLPTGYTFADASTQIDTTYNIENSTNYSAPSLKDIYVAEYKELSWPAINFTFSNTPIVVTATEIESPFTISFKYGDIVVATRTYTVSNKTITNPELPTSDDFAELAHYENLKWAAYSIPTTELADFEVQLEKTPKNYVITFKYEDYEQKVNYTYEDYLSSDFEIIIPAVPKVASYPELKHYTDIAWNEVVYPENLGSFEVSLNLVAKEYTLTAVCPEGYDVNWSCTFTVNDFVDNKYTFTTPAVPEGKTGYYLQWEDKEITLDNVQDVNTIELLEVPVVYTAIFKHNNETFAEVEYTVENYNTIDFAEPPTDPSGNNLYAWEPYTIDKDNLGTLNADKVTGYKIIKSVKLAFVTIEFYHENPTKFKYNNGTIAKAYLAIDVNDNVILENGKPVIYQATLENDDKVEVKTNLIEEVKNGVVLKPEYANEPSPVITLLELFAPEDEDCENAVDFAEISNNLETELNDMLTQCTTTGYLIRVYFD